MSKRDIATLAFRITGIYVVVQAVPLVSHIGFLFALVLSEDFRDTFSGAPERGFNAALVYQLVVILPFLILGCLGAYLVRFSRELAKKMFPEDAESTAETRYFGIHGMAYSLLGLFVIATAVPGLPLALRGISRLSLEGWTSFWVGYGGEQTLGFCLQVLLGVALLVGSRRFARALARLRSVSLYEEIGLCRECGYDLTGNTSGVCPECGEPISQEASMGGGSPPNGGGAHDPAAYPLQEKGQKRG